MSKKISEDEFYKRVKDKYPNENFEIIEYTTMSNPLKIRCNSCNQILCYPQAKNFLVKNKKFGCSDCNGLKQKINSNLQKVQQKYDILDITRKNNGSLWYTCKCKKCKRISTHELVSFLKNDCRCENGGNHWTKEELQNYLKTEYNNEYILLSEFENVNKKSLVRHSCGFIWSTTLAHILYNKTSCPKCSKKQSKGCKIISKILKDLKIDYETERLLDNSLQRFDFYLELHGQKYAIEYNGEQHYKYISFFHGNDINNFYKYQQRDIKKAQYCKDNNITLIIIPYNFSEEQIFTHITNVLSSSTTK